MRFNITSSICFRAPQTNIPSAISTWSAIPCARASTSTYSTNERTNAPISMISRTLVRTVVSARARRTKSRTMSPISWAMAEHIFISRVRGLFLARISRCAIRAAIGVWSPCAMSASASSWDMGEAMTPLVSFVVCRGVIMVLFGDGEFIAPSGYCVYERGFPSYVNFFTQRHDMRLDSVRKWIDRHIPHMLHQHAP